MVPALRGLSLQVPSGEICVIRGPNGSGKSTLVEILSGGLQPSAGRVSVTGSLRLLRQQGNILPELTVGEYLSLASQNVDSLLGDWDLAELRDARMATISSGNAQLVAAIAVLASEPAVLLADEPAASLSIAASENLYQRMTDYCRSKNITLLLVTHDQAAEAFADRVVRISDGRIGEEWQPGTSEKTVIDKHGWLRIPPSFAVEFPALTEIKLLTDSLELVGLAPKLATNKFLKREVKQELVRIECQDLATGFNNEAVFNSVSFTAFSGSLTAIHGGAGSGKTTVLRTITGQQDIWSGKLDVTGEVKFFEQVVEGLLSVQEAGASPEWIARLGLEDYANRPMNRLSGGQRQKSLLAIALSSISEILLLDEPTNALDVENRDLIMQILGEQSARTIIFTTNDSDISQHADQVVLLTSSERV
jgi:ABC-type multidrug transport system ATPase subunit